LADEGVRVAFTSRSQASLDETLRLLGGAESGHVPILIDVTEDGGPEQVARILSSVMPHVDIVVNNVGDTLGITDPLCSAADWRRVYRLNLEVHVEMNNLFIPGMRERGWGRIVNITAGAALENSGPVPYCSMKAAYTAYTRSMARVLAPDGVVMSAVLPGVVLTEEGHWQAVLRDRPAHAEQYLEERTVLKRFGHPEEVAPMVVFLCSDLASFCVGSIVPVEGGQARHYFAGNRLTT
jgi:3-oxoacyl-[acyl-carrier protein] reductase